MRMRRLDLILPKCMNILIFIRIDGAEREVFSSRLTLGQDVEEGRFSDVGNADDSHLQVGTDATDQWLLLRFLDFLRRHSEIDKFETAVSPLHWRS